MGRIGGNENSDSSCAGDLMGNHFPIHTQIKFKPNV